jgi:addiction module RelB/DinJ family antitoxin
MSKRSVINIRVEDSTKIAIEQLYKRFGISVSDAVNIFFSKSLMENGLPFDMKISSNHVSNNISNLLDGVTNDVVTDASNLFGDRLQEIILYGSYARGDFDDESDIDIAIILDVQRDEISEYRDAIAEIASNLNLKHEKLININCIPTDDFIKWQNDLPYYRNIAKEGVKLIA